MLIQDDILIVGALQSSISCPNGKEKTKTNIYYVALTGLH